MDDASGRFRDRLNDFYRPVVEILCEEYGQFELNDQRKAVYQEDSFDLELQRFVIEEENIEKVLDAVELTQGLIGNEEANQDLNHRFKEHGIGYEYVNRNIIRIDDQFIHAETVIPSLSLLSDPAYTGAEQGFLDAQKHYRHQDFDSTLNECLKAMESTLKIICEKRGWSYGPKNTAQKLLSCRKHEWGASGSTLIFITYLLYTRK